MITTRPHTRRSRMLRRILMLEDEMALLDRTYKPYSLSLLIGFSDKHLEGHGIALARRVERVKEERRNAISQ